jgi:hypothetical protein
MAHGLQLSSTAWRAAKQESGGVLVWGNDEDTCRENLLFTRIRDGGACGGK